MRAPEARPVALTFQAENETARLPAVAELSADTAPSQNFFMLFLHLRASDLAETMRS